ncbi:MAG TPA: helix-turn-helix domain-containing protein [Nocardioides sp.]|nr:helix-turn-helix domain-containing protein [Nocardioides sp.]
MPLGTDYARQDCSLARSLEVVGERWTLLILRDAFFGVRRFSDFQAHLDISKAVLSTRLDGLVADGLLTRTSTGHPEYEPTEDALGLWPVLYALGQWGDRRTTPGLPRRLYRHVGCGDLSPAGSCLSCGRSPAPGDIEVRPGPGSDPTRRDDPVSVALREPHRLLEPLAVR